MKPGQIRFPSDRLIPRGGEMHCHLFENPAVGVARNLYWSVTVEFEPIRYGNEEDPFECSLSCEWMTWPVRDWRQVGGRLDFQEGEGTVEASFYMTEHDPAEKTSLTVRHVHDDRFRIAVDMVVDFHGYYGGDAEHGMRVRTETEVRFTGLIVVPDNLSPAIPATPSDAVQAVSPFADLAGYAAPEAHGSHGFIFRPRPDFGGQSR